jgi:hypothetical protein
VGLTTPDLVEAAAQLKSLAFEQQPGRGLDP